MRYSTLQASRGIAALLVVAFHTSQTIFEDKRWWHIMPFRGIFDFGHAGVYFFFVLSGFIISNAHAADLGHPEQLRNYLGRRAIRVYPIYWIILAPLATLYYLKPAITKPELASHATIANSFLLVGWSSTASLAVAWTLFHEVLFYVLFAIAIISKWTGFALMTLWWLLCLVLMFGGLQHLPYFLNSVNLLFLIGVCVYIATCKKLISAPRIWSMVGCTVFLAVGLCETQIAKPSNFLSVVLYGASSGIIVAGLVSYEKQRTVTVPAFLILFGDASYCIYLCHYPALSLIARFWFRCVRDHAPNLSFLLVVLTAVVPGLLLHMTVERPLLTSLGKKWRRSIANSRGSIG